jgi:hypothetical protein
MAASQIRNTLVFAGAGCIDLDQLRDGVLVPSLDPVPAAVKAGRLAKLRIECAKCGRMGVYSVPRLVREGGGDAAIIGWIAEVSADCPRLRANQVYDSTARDARAWLR